MMQVLATETEPAFRRFTEWTAQRSAEYRLGNTPRKVADTFWALVARADRDPIVLDGQKITGDTIRSARAVFFHPAQAAPLVRTLQDAADGKPPANAEAALAQLNRAAGGAGTGTRTEPAPDNGTAVLWSVVCEDTDAWPRDPEQYRRDAVRDKAAYPLYGDMASTIKPCAFWTRPVEAPTPVRTRTKALIVQNEWDSQTPLVSAQGLRHALKNSKMVTVRGGEGHGVYLVDPASCGNAAVNGYLSTGRLPAADVTCETPPSAGTERRAPLTSPLPQHVPAGPGRF
jgi:hypothetical protein